MPAQSASTAKKKILFLSPYPYGKAASQRLKFEQYFPYFEANGYELETSSFIDDDFWNVVYKKGSFAQKAFHTLKGYARRFKDLFRLHKYDAVYVHLWVTPLGPPVFEWLVSKLSKKLVYDIDDMIHTRNDGINKLVQSVKGYKKPVALMKYADHVITCTPDLNQFARQYCAQCTDISSTLDTDRMQPAYRYTNDGTVTIGWTGTHTTVPFLHLLTPVFQKLATLRRFKLFVIGNFDFHMEGVPYEYLNWTRENEVSDLQKMDIGVYPLPVDDWVLGKSGLKALQYMTFAIPAVATNVGNAINRIIVQGENGFLVKTEEEWLETLVMLIDDPDLRRRVGLKARETVERDFSLKANRPVYLGILNSVTNQ